LLSACYVDKTVVSSVSVSLIGMQYFCWDADMQIPTGRSEQQDDKDKSAVLIGIDCLPFCFAFIVVNLAVLLATDVAPILF